MHDVTVRVDQLSKRYRIGQSAQYRDLRESLSHAVRVPIRMWQRARHHGAFDVDAEQDSIWALRNVCLEVKQGDVLGIIGRNGAGKTTLLRILSRITEPTSGRIDICGRVGSLLEVGTGFHPELTGRENIYLNGAILGMRKSDIEARFDEIVAFAEVDKFIDTPVKRYSSGMYVRLAFAVAAHMEPEILLVDEVLAVGDAAFQAKCLGKIGEFAGGGRTVLFVSHNMGAIRLLTNKCILLNNGELVAFGPSDDIVSQYLDDAYSEGSDGFVDFESHDWRKGTQKQLQLDMKFRSIRMTNRSRETTSLFYEREPIAVEFVFESTIQTDATEFIFIVLNLDGITVFSAFSGRTVDFVGEGIYKISCVLDPNILRSGTYRVRLYLRSHVWEDVIEEACTFRIISDPLGGDELSYGSTHPGLTGLVQVECTWGSVETI